VGSGAAGTSAESLLAQLTAAGTDPDAGKSSQHAAAQCFAAQAPAFKQFMEGLVLGPALKDKYLAVKEERREVEGGEEMEVA
jgi:hypothetical protein